MKKSGLGLSLGRLVSYKSATLLRGFVETWLGDGVKKKTTLKLQNYEFHRFHGFTKITYSINGSLYAANATKYFNANFKLCGTYVQ